MEELKAHKQCTDGNFDDWTARPRNGVFLILSCGSFRHPHCWQVSSYQIIGAGWKTVVYRHQIADTQVPWYAAEKECLWEMARFLEWMPQVVRNLCQEVKDYDDSNWPVREAKRESWHLVRWEAGTREESRVLEWAKRADTVRDWSSLSHDRLQWL